MSRHQQAADKSELYTGHDRFVEVNRMSRRPRNKRLLPLGPRRAQSASEFNSRSLREARARAALARSASTDDRSPRSSGAATPAVTSLTRLFSCVSMSSVHTRTQGTITEKRPGAAPRHGGRYQYTALEADSTAHERLELERKAREQAQSACLHYLRCCPRYSLLQHLNDIGSRVDKHWFIVRDGSVKTERLLTLVPKSSNCPIPTDADTRQVILDLFLALQHPYIYPVLDLEFREGVQANQTFIVLVLPFNTKGSLKDLIYKNTCLHDFCFLTKRQRTAPSSGKRKRIFGLPTRREHKRCAHSSWQDDWCDKYGQRSDGLPISQVQRLGRQILEALLFLKERGFPCCSHLHSGNVILQNGVARLSGLENTLFGYTSRIHPVIWSLARQEPSAVDVICFGHVLFEMCAGYELTTPKPSASNLADIDNYPQIIEVLDFIFQNPKCRYPSIEELLVCDFFRNIDLREMRSTSLPQVYHARLTASTLALLNDVKKQQKPKRGRRSHSASVSDPPSPSPRRDREQRSYEAERLDGSSVEATVYKCPILASNDYSLACDEAAKLDLETRV
ncbi:slowpoke-binding protein isoform X2 [Macrosteles quadrilineatus]|uniref:slowpoke-binding protein isoform X2 n=1 Tax=Macrosteles quadrilineatus TaxID=74068 RepID=UPI0023E09F85|nr:slowpoke-binding protein isoform X2 [Macrosteles quadrilineatus]